MLNVHEWLEERGLGEKAEAFANYDIDQHVLADLTGDDLKETGAWSRSERRRRDVDPSGFHADGEDVAVDRTIKAGSGS